MTAKKDWLGTYGQKSVRKFQEGGAMTAPTPTAAPEAASAAPQGGDLEAMIAQYAQTRDPQLAVAICDTIVELMARGGGAAGGGAPEGAAPMAKNGMKLSRGPVFKA